MLISDPSRELAIQRRNSADPPSLIGFLVTGS
jgi:hypothetical protein